MKSFLLVILSLIYVIQGDRCPNGGEIYERGITRKDKQLIVAFANKQRDQVLRNVCQSSFYVVGSKLGKGKRIRYDKGLEKNAQESISSCKVLQHEILGGKGGFHSVAKIQYKGQSSDPKSELDWATVLQKWHNDASKHGDNSYWLNAEALGCDYIKYRDASKSEHPYAKLFYCNIGIA